MDCHRKTPAQLLAEAAQAVRHLGWSWERLEAALPDADAPGVPLPELARRLGADLDRSDHRLALLALLHHDRDVVREREPDGRTLYRRRASWERRAARPAAPAPRRELPRAHVLARIPAAPPPRRGGR